MLRILTRDQLVDLSKRLQGTADEIEGVLQNQMGLDEYDEVDEIEAELGGLNVERCPGCDWWVESGELVDENCDIVDCENCRQ